MAEKAFITLIEDDPTQRRILMRMLENDFMVQSFDSCQSAQQGLQNAPVMPSLILCDITLPDGDGLALRRDMLKRGHLVDCPFIFLSSHDDHVMKHNAAQLGIDDFLSKPVTREELLYTLHRTIQRSRHLSATHNKRLDDQVTDILKPSLPPQIGAYKCQLAHRDIMAGGGDFVFHLPAKDAHFIIVGDVMGHGAPAKFFLHAYIGYLYGLFRSFQHHSLTPNAAELMQLLNDGVAEDEFLKRWLLTCLIVCIPTNGALTLCNAGHPCAWHVGRDGALPILLRGPMPGLIKDITYEETSVALDRHERLLLATDGVLLSESRIAAIQFDDGTNNAEKFMTQIQDDATLVIIERFASLPAQSSSYKQ